MENSTENKKDLKNFDIYRFAVTKGWADQESCGPIYAYNGDS